MLEKTKFIKSCNMPKGMIIHIFKMLNQEGVEIRPGTTKYWDDCVCPGDMEQTYRI